MNIYKATIGASIICSTMLNSCTKHNLHSEDCKCFNNTIQNITSFKEIECDSIIDQSTLMLIDLDDTIFTSTTHYGSVDFFKNLVRNNSLKKNISYEESIIDVYPRWVFSQKIIKTKIIDQSIHKIIKKTNSRDATILGFTARQPSVSNITLSQLEQHMIKFKQPQNFQFMKNYSNLNQKSKNIWGYDYKIATLHNGVVFCHDLNSKGMVFKDLISKLNTYRKKNNLLPITKVIFVDDSRNNLESVQQAANKANVNFYGYQFLNKNNN